MTNSLARFALAATALAGTTAMLAACASTDYVGEQIRASEQRQAAVDYAQNNEIAQLSGSLAEALERVNRGLALRDPGAKLTSAASSLIVTFGPNSTKIADEDRPRLTELAVALLEAGEDFHIEVQGHTDSSGSARANAEVGARRAEAVRLFLHEKGIPLRRISTISFGDTVPLVTGDDRTVQAGNRRAEIIVFR